MSGDLTRWNRAGLARFRYVDGNALIYLERLRAAMARAFRNPATGKLAWEDLEDGASAPAGDTLAERHARLAAQYHDERRDYGWEVLRSFARSTHVLAEHLDAYANEHFIGTATQWDNLRRLVAMLDYHPAPPASARTPLAFTAKEAGTLSAGFAVKNAPKDGSPPAIFETMAELEVDPALNALRPADWNRSQEDFVYGPASARFEAAFPLADGIEPPSVGSVAVLLIADATGGHVDGYAVAIAGISDGGLTLCGQPAADRTAISVKRWQVGLLTDPAKVMAPKLAGPRVVVLTPGHNLVAGRSRVAWNDGGWKAAAVEAVEGARVRLSTDDVPAKEVEIYPLAASARSFVDDRFRTVLATDRGAGGRVWRADLSEFDAQTEIGHEDVEDDSEEPSKLYEYVLAATAFYLPSGSDPVAKVVQSAPADIRLAGDPGDLAAGDWIARTDSSGASGFEAARVKSVTEAEDDYALEPCENLQTSGGLLHMLFERTIRPRDHDRNESLAYLAGAPSDAVTRIPVALEHRTKTLRRNRRVLVTAGGAAHLATVKRVDGEAMTIDIAPPLPVSNPEVTYLRGNTVILGNVVEAGHGETKPAKAIGSGDATASGQAFELNVEELSFVPDFTLPAGVRAAIEVEIDGRTWTQVANLRDSGPTEAHYEVRMTEAGVPLIRFGDGVHGRRLPTGANNVRATWRKGVGESGNLAPASLAKPVRPSPLIDAVSQPLPAAGGAGMEPVAALRENAPASVLTLDRAVSLEDHARLAATHASVLQAHAFRTPADVGRAAKVTVVIVPAGGEIGTLAPEISAYLRARTLPGVAVAVVPSQPLPLQLDVTLRIRTEEFDPEEVAAAVSSAFASAYDLTAAKLGQPLYRSQLLYVAERVAGVENAVVTILPATWVDASPPPAVTTSPTGGVRSVRPHPHQMLLFAPDHSTVAIRTEAFSL